MRSHGQVSGIGRPLSSEYITVTDGPAGNDPCCCLLESEVRMAEPKKGDQQEEQPHGHRDRGLVSEGPQKGRNRSTSTSHDPDSTRIEEKDTFRPDRDGPSS